jgi:putative transposase
VDRVALIPSTADAWLEGVVHTAARDVDAEVLAFGAASDHAHVLLRYPPATALADAVQALKGASAHAWNLYRPDRARLEWQDGYWAESFGPRALTGLTRYVRDQRRRHARAQPPEPWE